MSPKLFGNFPASTKQLMAENGVTGWSETPFKSDLQGYLNLGKIIF